MHIHILMILMTLFGGSMGSVSLLLIFEVNMPASSCHHKYYTPELNKLHKIINLVSTIFY